MEFRLLCTTLNCECLTLEVVDCADDSSFFLENIWYAVGQ